MKTTLAIVLTLLTTPVAAQDIGYKMDRIKKGSTITVKGRKGDLLTYEMMGKIGDHFYYHSFKGPDTTGSRHTIVTTDSDGNITRVAYPDGKSITFSPHSCYRVLGDCTYTQSRTNEPDKRLQRTTALDGTTLTFSLRNTDTNKLIVTGRAWLDRYGWPIDAMFKSPDGKISRDTVISRDYK